METITSQPATHQADGVIGAEVSHIYEAVVNYFLGAPTCVLGIITNIINIIIFIRQGFTDTVNISLVALTVSDLCSLLSLLFLEITWNPEQPVFSVNWVTSEVLYLTVGLLYNMFLRNINCITAYITLERCLCVVFPFTIKHTMTRKLNLVIIVTIYILMFLLNVPEYCNKYLGPSDSNPKLVGIVRRYARNPTDYLAARLYMLIQIISFSLVVICSVTLAWKVRESSRWRDHLPSAKSETGTNFRIRTYLIIRRILVIACVHIATFSTVFITAMIVLVEPEMSLTGRFDNEFRCLWSTVFFMTAIRSSSSILLYYKTGSRYRSTFAQVFKKRN